MAKARAGTGAGGRHSKIAQRRSPSLERREREKTETRAMILAAAREMFTREGFERTTMRAIADRIGYTATTIYHHFADKDALMLELCLNDFRALGKALATISQVADPVDRIRLMGRGYVRFAIENPEQFRFMFLVERPMTDPQTIHALDPTTDAYRSLCDAVSEAISAGRFRPELDNPQLVAQMLWGLVHGIATVYVATPPEKQKLIALQGAEETTQVACETILRGMLRAS